VIQSRLMHDASFSKLVQQEVIPYLG